MSDDQEIPDDPPRPYTIHETFLGGMLGNVDSHHATLDEAIAIATARRQETCDRLQASDSLAADSPRVRQ
jgi:hypothetical protein